MQDHEHDRLPAELTEIAHRLREDRPQASGLQLDQIKQRAQERARRQGRRRDPFMRSRLVITTALVVGILMSGAGAGLAVSGVSGAGSAGTAQYPTETTDTSTVLPTTETNPPTDGTVPTEASATRQVASNDDSSLPFTGYAAIPVLLAGIGLLGFGLVMRRRVSDQR
jgi:hypothetical protein